MNYEYLNACKSQSGLTNKAIALSKNISESTVSRFFHGEIKAPDIPLAKAICDAIGASLDQACGLIVPVDAAMTTPAPSIPAIVTDVVQTVSDIVDEQKVAEKVAEAIKESPIPTEIDHHKLAQEIVSLLPAPQPMECESCRTARLYESTIAFHRQAIAILGGGLGLLVLILVVMLFFGK